VTAPVPRAVRRLLLLLYPLLLLIPAADILGAAPILGDDHSSHAAAIHHLVALLGQGQTDLFCPAYNLGFPMYLYYQPLPHLAPAALHLLSAGLLPVQLCFNVTVAALVCLYPLAMFAGARRLGLGDAGALAAGALAPLVSSALGFGFTLNSVMGAGLYTQTWAMVLLPLCLGALWRYLMSGRGALAATGLLVLVFLSHAFYGVVAGTAAVVMVLVQPAQLQQRLPRLILVAAGALTTALFWLVPLLLTRDHMGGWPWGGQERWLGYGAARVASALARGALLDHGRPAPVISLALAVGVVVAARRWRSHPVARALLLLLGLFIFFLMGRRTFGHLVDIQPANLGLQLFRYLGAVHLMGVLLAGLGLGALLGAAARRLPAPAVVGLICAALALPLAGYASGAHRLFRTIESYSVKEADLRRMAAAVHAAHDRGVAPGRIYAHTKSGAGTHLVSALLARYTDQPMGQSYGVGMHDSLGFYYLEYLDPTDREQLALFNFRHLVARPGAPAARGLQPVVRGAGLNLYRLSGEHGYFMPLHDPVLLDGPPRQERERARRVRPRGGGGHVRSERVQPNQFTARLRMDRAGVVALKVAHHPFWHATVDGRPVPLLRVAPAFLAARVEAGEHELRFRFRNPWWQKALLALAALGWLLLGARALGARMKERRSP